MSLRDVWNEVKRNKEIYEANMRKFHESISAMVNSIRMTVAQLENAIPSVHARDPQTAERIREIIREINRQLEKATGMYY